MTLSARPTTTQTDLLKRPALIVFASNACIMILQLVAGRLVAPNIGVSLYTWTSIIGVMLAGISLGNFVSGKLSDRFASRRMLGATFILTGVSCLSVLMWLALLGGKNPFHTEALPTVVPILLFVALVYFLPSFAIGAISPVVIKLAVDDLSRTGNIVGRIYAMSALGNIVGTFATGYFLIFYFGARSILLGCAGFLILMGVSLGDWRNAREYVRATSPLTDNDLLATTRTATEPLPFPEWIVFISNACLMAIEIVAGRIIAPTVGVSLYTWTTVIGVVFAGMSLGNFIGGKISDRFPSRQTLAAMLISAALGAAYIFFVMNTNGGLPDLPDLAVSLPVRMLLFVSTIFLVPSVLLGTIPPIVVKLALRNLDESGAAVGRINAMSSLGSILGTFATGYVLISLLGTRMIVLVVVAVLMAMGVWLGKWGGAKMPARAAGSLLAAALLALPFVPLPEIQKTLKGPCLRETDYFCIRIRDDDRDGRRYKVLILDRLVHSYTNSDDARDLRYQYEKVGAEVADFLSERDGRVDSFFIGGGGYSLPKYIELEHPQSILDVAEIDPGVTAIARDELGLARNTKIKSLNADARLILSAISPTHKYNFVLGDAFNDFSVPYHLTTREFNRLVRSHMTDDGIYMLNLIDGGDLPFLGAFARTLRQTFAYVYVVTNGGQLRGTLRATYVILASPQPIDLEALRRFPSHDGEKNIGQWLVEQRETESLIASDNLILTDDFVPTDRLLAPMFEASEAKR
jgi:MFS family permease/spermidine synthase